MLFEESIRRSEDQKSVHAAIKRVSPVSSTDHSGRAMQDCEFGRTLQCLEVAAAGRERRRYLSHYRRVYCVPEWTRSVSRKPCWFEAVATKEVVERDAAGSGDRSK